MVKIQCEFAIDSMHHVVILVKLVNSQFTSKSTKMRYRYALCSGLYLGFLRIQEAQLSPRDVAQRMLNIPCRITFVRSFVIAGRGPAYS